jgi:hypothetical protein
MAEDLEIAEGEVQSRRTRRRTAAPATPLADGAQPLSPRVAAEQSESDLEDVDPMLLKLSKMMERQSRKSDASWDRRIGNLQKGLESRMDMKLKQQDDRWDKRMAEMRNDIMKEVDKKLVAVPASDLESRLSVLEGARSTAASVSGVSARGVATQSRPTGPISPTVVIRWLQDDDDHQDENLNVTDTEAQAVIELAKSWGIDFSWVDEEETQKANRKVLSTKITVRLRKLEGGGDSEAWKWKQAFDKAAADTAYKIKDRVPRTRVQASPEKEAMINAVSRALAVLRKKGCSREILKPQWEPAKVFHRPGGTARPSLLIEWTAAGGYALREQNLAKILPGLRAEDLMSELRSS